MKFAKVKSAAGASVDVRVSEALYGMGGRLSVQISNQTCVTKEKKQRNHREQYTHVVIGKKKGDQLRLCGSAKAQTAMYFTSHVFHLSEDRREMDSN